MEPLQWQEPRAPHHLVTPSWVWAQVRIIRKPKDRFCVRPHFGDNIVPYPGIVGDIEHQFRIGDAGLIVRGCPFGFAHFGEGIDFPVDERNHFIDHHFTVHRLVPFRVAGLRLDMLGKGIGKLRERPIVRLRSFSDGPNPALDDHGSDVTFSEPSD